MIHCEFTFPIRNIAIINAGVNAFSEVTNLKYYYFRSGKWYKTKEFFEINEYRLTFHSFHRMETAEGIFCIVQSLSRICPCSGPVGHHGYGCLCFDAHPDWIHVLDDQWEVVHSWRCSFRILCSAGTTIYGVTDQFGGLVTYPPEKHVVRYTIDGQQLPPLNHVHMKKPKHVKAMYSQQLGKNVVFVSDWNANKLFLFLDDKLCWQWQSEEFCKVGPVAMSKITGRLYAVITDYGDDDYDDDELNSSTIKMLDLNGMCFSSFCGMVVVFPQFMALVY